MTERLILTAAELQPGDYINEFADTVTAVRESDRYLGIREVEFARAPGMFPLFFGDWYHVTRPESGQPDDQPDEPPAAWDDDSDRW